MRPVGEGAVVYQLTRWLLASAVVVTTLWIGAVVWILASPIGDATAADDTLTESLRADITELTTRLGELGSTIEWLENRDLGDGIDALSGELAALSARIDATEATLDALTTPPPEPTPHPLSTDGKDLYSCADFDSWEEAQAVFEANEPGDPNYMDTNDNGIACEQIRK